MARQTKGFFAAALSRKRGSRLFAAHGLPVHQCCASSHWCHTAKYGSASVLRCRKKGRSALAVYGPSHFSHAAPARKKEGRALAAHGPPHFSHAAPARMGAFVWHQNTVPLARRSRAMAQYSRSDTIFRGPLLPLPGMMTTLCQVSDHLRGKVHHHSSPRFYRPHTVCNAA